MNKILCGFLCLSTHVLWAQEALMMVPPSPADPLDPWLGAWQGECENVRPSQATPIGATFKLIRTVEKKENGVYAFHSVYQSSQYPEMVKDYNLVAIDVSQGHYQIDEKNGVLIDTYIALKTMYSAFEVYGTKLISTDKIERQKWISEILTFKNEGIPSAGGQVLSFPFITNQRCVLSKKK